MVSEVAWRAFSVGVITETGVAGCSSTSGSCPGEEGDSISLSKWYCVLWQRLRCMLRHREVRTVCETSVRCMRGILKIYSDRVGDVVSTGERV